MSDEELETPKEMGRQWRMLTEAVSDLEHKADVSVLYGQRHSMLSVTDVSWPSRKRQEHKDADRASNATCYSQTNSPERPLPSSHGRIRSSCSPAGCSPRYT